MRFFSSPDRRLALLCIALAIVAGSVWLPADIDTGLIEKVRRQVRIGDAAMPTLALAVILLGSTLALISPDPEAPDLRWRHITFLTALLATVAISFALMRWLGPVAAMIGGAEGEYRNLRDTVPWKYIGFVAGGTFLVTGLKAFVDGRPTLKGVTIGFCACLALIAIYDLPFDDLLLPPNGDV